MAARSSRALLTAGGTAAITAVAAFVANHPPVQAVFAAIPLLDRLPAVVLFGDRLLISVLIATGVVTATLFRLYRPRPQRILDTVFQTERGVVVATSVLATIGYFDYSLRLPRLTLVITTALLLAALPVWFSALRLWRQTRTERVIVVGKDSDKIASVVEALPSPIVGYVYSPTEASSASESPDTALVTDGGVAVNALADYDCLGGLSRLEDIVVEADVDTVVVTLSQSDRAEFFGVLQTCHDNGVAVKVHREHVDNVLPLDASSEFVTVDLEPLDWESRAAKRAFDIVFAGVGLLASAPLLTVIAVAIRLDSPGPVFYTQERTAEFGGTFLIRKFRTMIPEGESAEPGTNENRVTRVGGILRRTHLDELPQLWSILVGEMSVVGPRAVWTAEEQLLQEEVPTWKKRWFVKPGLTGLAQVNDVSSENPEAKLRADLEYIQRQSFWFDLKIVIRQILLVVRDVGSLFDEDQD
jgi:lipopolysaccharide/colanic/teichoic acid biosynthesis glycosyltransferase